MYNDINFLGPLFAFLMFFILIAFLVDIFSPTKSRKYRKMLADLFVAGRIKQLAIEKGIVLAEEYESFKKWLKKQRISEMDLDNTIEEELKDEIGDAEKEFKEQLKGGNK